MVDHNPLSPQNLKKDLPASLVVALVALPLCLGIAVASGASPLSGLLAGIVGGIVVGMLSNSALGVSGPAAGLIGVVAPAIVTLGGFPMLLTAIIIGGALQIVLSIMKAGIIAYYFPSSVIKGMLSGIGIVLILKQLPHAVGDDIPSEVDMGFHQPSGGNTFTELANMFNFVSEGVIVVTLISMAVLILWEAKFIKKIPAFQIIQAPLLVVIIGIILKNVFNGTVLEIADSHTVSLPVVSSIGGFVSEFTFPDFSGFTDPLVWKIGATIAIVASLETLLCLEATDKLDPEKRVSSTNQELLAQGVGNMTAGFIGGLPVTQVIVRSSANVQSGGKTKMSAIVHGVILLMFILLIPGLLNMIPMASLAAILFMVGYKLSKPSIFKAMYKQGLSQFLPFIVTIVTFIFTDDILQGISLGFAIAVFNILYNNYKIPFHFRKDSETEDTPYVIRLSEHVTFLNKAGIINTLKHIPDNSRVIIDSTRSHKIHHDVVEAIMDFCQSAETRDIEVELIGDIVEKEERPNPIKDFAQALKRHKA